MNQDHTSQSGTAKVGVDEARWLYSTYRQRVLDEYTFINHRLSWLVVLSSLLFSGMVLSREVPQRATLWWILVAVAFVTVIAAFASVYAARSEVRELREDYRKRLARLRIEPEELPLTARDHHHALGSALERAIPICMLILWLVVAGWLIMLNSMGKLAN